MAIELHLQKTTKTPWGFRLAGGVEYEVPLTVIKVAESSIAENAGMKEGDVIVRINDIPTAGLTHNQAHDVLLEVGNDFILAVRRGDLSHLPPRLLLYETSVENAEDMVNHEAINAYGSGEENNDSDLNITDEEIVNIIGEQVHVLAQKASEKNSTKIEDIQTLENELKADIKVVHKQSEVSKVMFSEEKTHEKKWSTFLQKPINPKPKPKPKELEGPKVPPYRVVIKKQPKKDQQAIKENSCNAQEQNKQEEFTEPEEQTMYLTEDPISQDKTSDNIAELNQDIDKSECEECVSNKYDHEAENDINEPLDSEEIEKVENCFDEQETEITPEKRISINLEEQLAQVRQQLQALAQLPSTIQETLNAVTQQLSEIVLANQHQEQEVIVETKVTIQEEAAEEYLQMPEVGEEQALSVVEEESYEHYNEGIKEDVEEEVPENIKNESEEEQALFEELERQIEEEEERKIQEEMEARRTEQERIQKKDKERRSSQLRTPLQRPIILPGGRKWSDAGDAVSKVRRPSMTDEKIANTINMFSEVIVGHTMGINFLKYQPPPKNLAHLQKSAVYRLVHDIEPPPRGVIARDGKILAEQDYYIDKCENEDSPA